MWIRWILGSYMAWVLWQLVAWTDVLLSEKSRIVLLYQRQDRWLLSLFDLWGNTVFVNSILFLGIAFAISFVLGKNIRLSAVFIFLVFLMVSLRNPLLRDLQFHYLGWLLLAYILSPQSASTSPDGRMPRPILIAGWIVFGVSYSVSGFGKWNYGPWHTGEALGMFSPSLQPISWILTPMTLFAELACLPMILYRPTRIVSWSILTLMHFGIASFGILTDLALSILLFHFFLFDPQWVSKLPFFCSSK